MAPKTTLSSWPERDTWVHNTKDVYEYAQKSMANNPPAVRNAISLQLAEHLVSDFTMAISVFTLLTKVYSVPSLSARSLHSTMKLTSCSPTVCSLFTPLSTAGLGPLLLSMLLIASSPRWKLSDPRSRLLKLVSVNTSITGSFTDHCTRWEKATHSLCSRGSFRWWGWRPNRQQGSWRRYRGMFTSFTIVHIISQVISLLDGWTQRPKRLCPRSQGVWSL